MSGSTLLERALLGIAGLALLVLLFFFLAAALVVGTIMVVALGARLWWLKRSLRHTRHTRHTQPAGPLTAEYTVIEREPAAQARLPDDD